MCSWEMTAEQHISQELSCWWSPLRPFLKLAPVLLCLFHAFKPLQSPRAAAVGSWSRAGQPCPRGPSGSGFGLAVWLPSSHWEEEASSSPFPFFCCCLSRGAGHPGEGSPLCCAPFRLCCRGSAVCSCPRVLEKAACCSRRLRGFYFFPCLTSATFRSVGHGHCAYRVMLCPPCSVPAWRAVEWDLGKSFTRLFYCEP